MVKENQTNINMMFLKKIKSENSFIYNHKKKKMQ